jgi:hypothetical protein
MDNAAFNGQAAYVFESGCYGYSEINKFMHGMFSKDHGQSLTEKFRYHSHTFQEKTTSPHLQAADVLVWHAQKQYSRMPNKTEGIRRDFEELLEVKTLNFNFDRNSLLVLAKRYEKLGVQYAQEP